METAAPTPAPRPRRRTAAALLAGALALAGAACSDDGRTLALPAPGQDTTTTTAPPAVVDGSGVVGTFSVSIPGVDAGGELPARATCSGERVSPALSWTAVPEGTTELALVVRDRDADGYVHWLVTGIDPLTPGFDEGGVPEAAVVQVNTAGAIGWQPPCPPEGDDRHVYDVVLHALRSPVDIDPALPADEAAALVEGASEEEASLAVTVTPPATGAGSAP